MKIYRIAKEKECLTPEEREKIEKMFDDIQCSFAKDEDGYYCYTHRARSKSYPSISQIPKSKVDFINSTSFAIVPVKTSSGANWYKTAVADGEFRDWKNKVDKVKDEVRDLKKDDKDLDKRVSDLEKEIKALNIGHRRFFQAQSEFNSLQRRLERMETVVQEWSNFKKEMADDIKKQVEKHTKARIGDITPQAY